MHERPGFGHGQEYLVSRGGNGSGERGVAVGRMGNIPPGLSQRLSSQSLGDSDQAPCLTVLVQESGDQPPDGVADNEVVKLKYPVCSFCHYALGGTGAIDPENPRDERGNLQVFHHPGDGMHRPGWETCLSGYVQENWAFNPHYVPPNFIVVSTARAKKGLRLPPIIMPRDIGGSG